MSVTSSLPRLSFSLLFILFLNNTVSAQDAAKLISSLNISGSSNIISIDSRVYYFQQSVGQPGIVGLSGGNGYYARQGFVQPLAGRDGKKKEGDLQADIYPNPFTDHLTIKFSETVRDPLYVTIYDLNGRVVYLKKFIPAPEIMLGLPGLTGSFYMLRVTAATRSFYAKVIRLSH